MGRGPAMIVFNFACYASVTGRMEEAKEGLRYAIDLDKDIRALALDDEDLKPRGLDRRFEIVGRAFQVLDSSLFSRKSSIWSRFSKR